MLSRISSGIGQRSWCILPLRGGNYFQTLHRFYATSNTEKTPIIPKKSADTGFEEMMEDRTKALIRSLGVAPMEGTVESSDNPMAAVPVREALEPARVYHFDTQKIYYTLKYAGLTQSQADIVMRTLRDMTGEFAKDCEDSSVPSSAGANEAYLFDAASSEMRNDVETNRIGQFALHKSGLARLQRGVEILEHEATEMASQLKSDLDIEFHERKNAARDEENTINMRIQELYHKISTRLNSELKSEIENLRWQITRRSLAAIGTVVATLLYATQSLNQKEKRKPQTQAKETQGPEVGVPMLPTSGYSEETDEPIDIPDLDTEQKKVVKLF